MTSPLHGRSQVYPENDVTVFTLLFHVDLAKSLKCKYLHGHPDDAQGGNYDAKCGHENSWHLLLGPDRQFCLKFQIAERWQHKG